PRTTSTARPSSPGPCARDSPPALLLRHNASRDSHAAHLLPTHPMQIKRALERVPGGMMIIPLVLGATINTFAPHTATFFGSYTGALFTGALPILAVFYVCIGAKISLRSLPQIVRK